MGTSRIRPEIGREPVLYHCIEGLFITDNTHRCYCQQCEYETGACQFEEILFRRWQQCRRCKTNKHFHYNPIKTGN